MEQRCGVPGLPSRASAGGPGRSGLLRGAGFSGLGLGFCVGLEIMVPNPSNKTVSGFGFRA